MASQGKLRFSFTGTGMEYFNIWIVNLVLTIMTLGIYSAWAKVRRRQYFCRHTWLNGANFDYCGDPVAILKGRVFAVLLLAIFVLCSISQYLPFSWTWGWAMLLPIVLVLPFLRYRAFHFRAVNTVYSGLRFDFGAKLDEAYKALLLWPLLAVLTMLLLTPSAHHRLTQFQHEHAQFGRSQFRFAAPVSSFYTLYARTLLLTVALLAALALVFTRAMPVLNMSVAQHFDPDKSGMVMMGSFAIIGLLTLLIGALLIVPYFVARLQGIVWNNTHLAEHQLGCNLGARGLCWVQFTNFLGIVLTLGLYKPFADIRLARYRLQHMWLESRGILDQFVRDARQDAMG